MKVSLNTIKQYIDFELPPVDELVKRINEQLGGVEEVIDLGAKYIDAVIVKVVEAEQHPDADRLKVTKVDDGGVVTDVPRDKNGYIQVVCGAPNAQAGMFAVWLPPKSTVPASFDEKEPFVLDARELRGVLSQGMLAAADELAIGTDHEGIIEIDPEEWKPSSDQIKPGASLAEVYGLDDTIIDIENKMFTHRPDLFGQLGVAREIAGILGQQFTSPEWYKALPEFNRGEGLELSVENEAYEKVPRFMAVAMKSVEVKPSPLWLQCALVAMGSKPINNIVDVTNYVMLLTAQPTHAYDYDKLRGQKLGTRMAREGEKVELLNGKTYELHKDDIVIVDGEGVVGLGGIMGGGNSEVSQETKNIVLEVANFDMYTVRKSSMRHGLFTDALTRFNKGQSSLQNDRILNLLMMSIKDVSPAEQASEVFDQKQNHAAASVEVNKTFINERLGLNLDDSEISTLLGNVEVTVNIQDSMRTIITPPFWRTDIEVAEDIVEEVGRLYGFDKLPRELPMRSMKPAEKNEVRELKQKVRENLSKAGANEVLTYSFVHEKVLRNVGQDPARAFKLSNALSPDLQYYRLSLLPSILTHVNANIRNGYDEFSLFEIGKAHHKDEFDNDGLPREFDRLAGVYTSKESPDGAPYYTARRIVEQIIDAKSVRYQPLSEFDFGDHDTLKQLAAPFDVNRSAMLWHGDEFGGVVGELKQSALKAFKLPANTAVFELFLSFIGATSGGEAYRPLSKFPSVTQDISLKVSEDVSYEDVYQIVQSTVQRDELDTKLSPVAIYQAENDATSKTITLRLTVTSHEKTLRDDDVSQLLEGAARAANQQAGAELI